MMRALFVVAALGLASCGGDKASGPPFTVESVAPGSGPSGELGTEQQALLELAAKRAAEVETYAGTYEVSLTSNEPGTSDFEMAGAMRFQAPDITYMEIELDGDEFEILSYPPDDFMRLSGEPDWFLLPEEGDAYESFVDANTIRTMGALIDRLGSVEDHGLEEVDGRQLRAFTGEFQPASVCLRVAVECGASRTAKGIATRG